MRILLSSKLGKNAQLMFSTGDKYPELIPEVCLFRSFQINLSLVLISYIFDSLIIYQNENFLTQQKEITYDLFKLSLISDRLHNVNTVEFTNKYEKKEEKSNIYKTNRATMTMQFGESVPENLKELASTRKFTT